jgi:hypothetical protein
MKENTPDPLRPGHIEGQNPNTPERLPEHTAYYTKGRGSQRGFLNTLIATAVVVVVTIGLWAFIRSF